MKRPSSSSSVPALRPRVSRLALALGWLLAGAVAPAQPAAPSGPVEVPPLGSTNAAPRPNPTPTPPLRPTPLPAATTPPTATAPAGATAPRPAGVRPGFAPVGAPPPPGAGPGPGPGPGTVLPVAPGAPGAEGEGEGDESDVGFSAEQAAQLEEGDIVTLQLNNAPLDSVLDIYSGLVRRVLLRPPQLAGGPITLKITDLTREETIEAFNGVLALNGISVVPVGEKFVKVVPSQEVVNQGAKQNDEDPTTFSELGQFVTKLVRVTKIKPGDIAQAVQAFASTKVQNPVLVFDDQNFFVLRDMAANVKRMTELIKELDVTPELDYKLEVIPIRYGKVDEIYETLNSVVTGSGGGGGFASGGGSSRTSGRASSLRSGAGGAGAGGIGNTGMNNQFSPQQAGSTTRGGMSSPGAARSSLADRLRQVSAMGAGGGAAGGAQVNLLEGARIIPDMRSNSLLVYASKEEYKMLTNIVAKIDTLLAQVLIESIILEVTLEKGKEFGVSMVQQPRQFGNWGTTGGSMNDASIATNLLGNALPGGFSYFGQYKDQFSIALSAMANDSNAKVLARPRIQTTHAQPANFAIGDTVPYPRSSSYGGFGGVGGGFSPFTTYDEKEVLTMLAVTPYITPDGLVTLEVEQTIDQLGPTVKVGQDEVPTIRKREASAVLSVRDREPVILGGFITDRSTDSNSGVPWLKDLPLLGWAFRSKNSFKQRSELIVLIRPTILNSPQEAAKLAELEQRSLPNAAAAERAFKEAEAKMAEKLGVAPGTTNAPTVDKKKTRRGSRAKRDE